jgi:peptidoglycan/xylan/chitin deacetylase (PgdA/CDA1 family)
MSCGPSTITHRVGLPGSISVNGRVVPLAGLDTVGAALSKTEAHIPSGRLLSVVRHHPLGSDQQGGAVLVNGTAADLEASLHDGDHVVTVPGPDTLEPTRTAVEPYGLHLVAGLEVGGHPGTARVTRGAVSGEVLKRVVLTAASKGRLSSPRQIALTFDDGPNPVWTPKVLALLARAHVHATFCLIGRQAVQYPELVRAIVAGGHTLCNHTFDHDEHLPSRPAAVQRQDLVKAQQAITKASGGVVPRLYRAPGGSWSPQVEQLARGLHMTPLKWNVDPRDWAKPGTNAIIAVTLAQLRPGGMVLLHDGGGGREQTYAALAFLLNRLPQLHFTYGIPRA